MDPESLDPESLLEAVVTQISFHGDAGVRLDEVFQELTDAGVPTDVAQRAFLRRALLTVRGLATMPDSSGLPKRARASSRLQEHALGVRCEELIGVQAAILRAVAQSRSVGRSINSLRPVVNLEPLQIHPHASALVRLGLISRSWSTGMRNSCTLFRLARFTEAAPLEAEEEVALARSAVVRLLEQLPGGAVYAESVPGATGLSRQAMGLLINHVAEVSSGAAAAPAEADDEQGSSAVAAAAAGVPHAPSLSLVMDVLGDGGVGLEDGALPPSRPCFLLRRRPPLQPPTPSLQARDLVAAGHSCCWTWPGIAPPDHADGTPALSGDPRFAALELPGAVQAYRMLLLRPPLAGEGLTASDMQLELNQRFARATHDFEAMVDDLDLAQGGGLAKVPRGRTHVIGAYADRALAVSEPQADQPGEELRAAGLRRLAAAWEDPFSAGVRTAMQDHAHRLLGTAAPVDPTLLGGAVLAVADGVIAGAGQYAGAASDSGGDDGCEVVVAAASDIIPQRGLATAAAVAPAPVPPAPPLSLPADRLYTAPLQMRSRKRGPVRQLIVPASRHLTALAAHVRSNNAALRLQVGDACITIPGLGAGASVPAVHTDVDAADLSALPAPKLKSTLAANSEDEEVGDAGLAALEDAISDSGGSRGSRPGGGQSPDPIVPVPVEEVTKRKKRGSGAAAAAGPRKKKRGGLLEPVSLTALLQIDGDDTAAAAGAALSGGVDGSEVAKAAIDAGSIVSGSAAPRRPAPRILPRVLHAAVVAKPAREIEPIPPIPSVPVSFAASFHIPLPPNSRRRPHWRPTDERRLIFAWAWQRVFTERVAQERFRAAGERLAARQAKRSQGLAAAAAVVVPAEGNEAGEAEGEEGEPRNGSADEGADAAIAEPLPALPLVPRTYSVDYKPVSEALGGVDSKSIIRRLKYIERRRPAAIVELSNVLARLRELLGVTSFTGAAVTSGHVTSRFSMSAPLSAEPPGPVAAILPVLSDEWLRGATLELPGEADRSLADNSDGSSTGSSEEGVEDAAGPDGAEEGGAALAVAGRKRPRGSKSAVVAAAATDGAGEEAAPSRRGAPTGVRLEPRPAAAAAAAASADPLAAVLSATTFVHCSAPALSYTAPTGIEVDAGAARGGPSDPFVGAHNDEAVALWKVLRVVAQRSDRLQARIAADARGTAPPSDAFLVALLHEMGQDMDVPACFAVLTQKRLVGGAGESGVEQKSKATRGSYSAAPRIVDLYCGGAPLGRVADPTAISAELMVGWPELPKTRDAAPTAVHVSAASGVRECVALYDALASGTFPRIDVHPVNVAAGPTAEARVASPGVQNTAPLPDTAAVLAAAAAGDRSGDDEAGLFPELDADQPPAAGIAELGQAPPIVRSEPEPHARPANLTTNVEFIANRAQMAQRRLVAAGLLPCSFVPDPEAVFPQEGHISFRKPQAREKIQLLQMDVLPLADPLGEHVALPPETRLGLFCNEPFGQATPRRSSIAAAGAILQAHAERLTAALRSAARATILAAADVGQHGIPLAESARRVALSAPGTPAPSRVRLGAAAAPPSVPPPPALLLMLAARAALREELQVSPELEAVAGFHGEVLVAAGTSMARSVFTVSAATEGGGGARRPFRSWTALLCGRPGEAVRVEAGAVWALTSRIVTLVSDAQSLSEARVVAALSPVAPADVRALLRFLCCRGVLDRAYLLASALPASAGPLSPLESASSLAARAKSAVLAAIVPQGDAAASEALRDVDPGTLLRAAADAWFTVAAPQFQAAKPGAAAAVAADQGSAETQESGGCAVDESTSTALAALNQAPCDLLELPGVITSYSLSMQAFRAMQALADDLHVHVSKPVGTAPLALPDLQAELSEAAGGGAGLVLAEASAEV